MEQLSVTSLFQQLLHYRDRSVEEMGRYDNFIHRVTCLEPGHTFHIYSEDCQQAIS
ncbi:MAG: hypothetical protein F6K41_12155 [Symploca sp. SIO3E6]|nr:hypothetical protein [Caldora sp. SIO3E6]